MKARLIVVMVLVCGTMLWAQSTTPKTPPANTQTETGAGTAKSTQKTPSQRAGKSNWQAMHAQRLQEFKADLQKMQSLLDEMKSSVANMDAKDQPAMQANVQMWQMMVDHFSGMVQHMSEMPPGGKRGMHHHHGGMGGMGGGMGGPPPSSGTQPGTGTPPPQ